MIMIIQTFMRGRFGCVLESSSIAVDELLTGCNGRGLVGRHVASDTETATPETNVIIMECRKATSGDYP